MLYSAYVGRNAPVFRALLECYLSPESIIADVTYGKGVFWSDIPVGRYNLWPSDLLTGTDCRHLPYPNDSVDAVVLDPPYGRQGRGGSGEYAQLKLYYQTMPTMRDVLDLYIEAGHEAWRVLKPHGLLIVKCQDQVEWTKQHWLSQDIPHRLQREFKLEDMIVVVRPQRPSLPPNIAKQTHARRRHSYFLILRKRSLPTA